MLFLEDSYIKKFEAKIISYENNKLILDKTAFYAKGGGQPGDVGKIEIDNQIINIIDTIKKDNDILHITKEDVQKIDNKNIIGFLDWEKRYKNMKMHSALHLLCSVIPYGVTGGQINYNKGRLDFDTEDKKIMKEKIEDKLNNLIVEDHKIEYQWITLDELDKNPELVRTMSVKPPRVSEKIRLVKIGNIDIQPCGGTHVKSTSEIKKISVTKIENKGKKNKRVNIEIN